VVRHAARLSGLDGLAVTKLDVLSGLDPLRICVGYRIDGKTVDHMRRAALGSRLRSRSTRSYRDPGELSRASRLEDLPDAARRYLDRIAELTGVTVQIVSVGARRDETLVLADPLG